ncbi:Hpt domain-containing protein [Methylomonas sp. LL1]|uniref:Hpt domain-containing protein n=1 Tax=Methylomonas sp. LL1 TaxID=2785785 RepID=UPI0018C387A7|nr:Hpt domain-containing protein [Methylomonas sp. LL1]QPK64389.1 Hpt domain-containing protein [Methylomonas sp. LL1]
MSANADMLPRQPACDAILDTAKALTHLSGNQELYQRMLVKFLDKHVDDASILRRLFAAGNLDEAKRLAHTLKGIAGTLGASELQKTTLMLENLARNDATEPQIKQQLDLLTDNLAAACSAIAANLSAQEPSASTPSSAAPEQIRALTESLLELLQDGNMKANKIWRELAPLVKYKVNPTICGKLDQLIENYDFPEAWALLREIANTYQLGKS